MNKKLIQVHAKTPQLLHCSHCDGPSVEVTAFYKELEENSSFGFQTYLECCKDLVGTVSDWYELEEYNKITQKEKFQGIVINKIKGYQE